MSRRELLTEEERAQLFGVPVEDDWRVAWLISRSFLIPNEMTEFAEP
jgi:hypothetical protein